MGAIKAFLMSNAATLRKSRTIGTIGQRASPKSLSAGIPLTDTEPSLEWLSPRAALDHFLCLRSTIRTVRAHPGIRWPSSIDWHIDWDPMARELTVILPLKVAIFGRSST